MPIRNNEELFNAYTYRIQDTQIKIIPIVKRGGTEWEIRLFRDGQQGPMWTGEVLTQDVLDIFDVPKLPENKLAQVNECTKWASRFLDYDTDFNRKTRGRASISDLYELTSQGKLVERFSD